MSPNDKAHFQELAEAYVAGSLSEPQHHDLETRLRSDEAARLFFLGYLQVHAGLAWEYRGLLGDVPHSTGPSTTASRLARFVRPTLRRYFGWLGAVAAVVTIVAISQWYGGSHRSAPSQVARVTGMLAPVWGDQGNPGADGLLTAGVVELRAGMVELEADQGTTLVVEGPARFELLDGKHARLLVGSMVVRMARGSSGFVVELPHMRVIDLGTEFGTRVTPDGQSLVQVFDGSVRAESSRGQRQLARGQALTVTDSGEVAASNFREDDFIRRIPPAPLGTQTGGILYNQSELESVEVAPAPPDVQIDGDLAEWGHVPAFHARCRAPYDKGYFLDGRMMYDARYLYLGAHVGDPEPMCNVVNAVTNPDRVFAGGSVIVRLSMERAHGWPLKCSASDWLRPATPAMRALAASDRVASLTMWFDAKVGQPRLNVRYGLDFHDRDTGPPAWRGAFRKDPNGRGYTVEYAIPWTMLNCADDPPRPGDVLPAVWTVHWSDAIGQTCRGYLVEVTNHGQTGVPGYTFQHGPCWGKAIFLPKK